MHYFTRNRLLFKYTIPIYRHTHTHTYTQKYYKYSSSWVQIYDIYCKYVNVLTQFWLFICRQTRTHCVIYQYTYTLWKYMSYISWFFSYIRCNEYISILDATPALTFTYSCTYLYMCRLVSEKIMLQFHYSTISMEYHCIHFLVYITRVLCFWRRFIHATRELHTYPYSHISTKLMQW